VFRAVIYNKGAMVLHMLRRFVGEGCFFAGVRQFYHDWRFKKAGTNDFRLAMEHTCGRDLSPFFEAWIYGTTIPKLRFSASVAGNGATVRLEHRETVVPVPVTVTVTYVDGTTDEIVVAVTERVVERTVPLRGGVRSIDANKDNAALADIDS
jgi:aminopeptidase N